MSYRSQSPDTSPEIDRLVFERYRSMSALESIERVRELNAWAFERARAGLRSRHPDADDDEIELRLAVIKYGPELIGRAVNRDLRELDP